MPKPIPADLAIDLFEALKEARRLQLQPALSSAVQDVGVAAIDADLQRLVPPDALNHVAALGLRGERVFPVPVILSHAPPLIGYYRMLLGLSRKEFSRLQRLGYGPWMTAEENGRLSPRLQAQLDDFCLALIRPLGELVQAMQVFDDRDLSDLTLLTLGPTLQGGRNTVIGSKAADEVFQSIRSLVAPWVTFERHHLLRVTLPNGVVIEVLEGSDPDIRIDIGSGVSSQPLLAIEIKGGRDVSNAHNRAGEAEKSQIKAAAMGYRHRWTVIRMAGVDRQRIRTETPSSTKIFDAAEVVTRAGGDWDAFQEALADILSVNEWPA